jgi:molecular chaperone DnaK (HSP70)
MAEKIGIDLGTTNSLISVVTAKGLVKSFTERDRPHPSVVHYAGGNVICGTKAKLKVDQTESGVQGSTVKGPKKYLSSDVINVGGVNKNPKDIVTDLIHYLKEHADSEDDDNIANLQYAVVTIPVAMDGRGRRALREAFLNADIHIEAFVHEPLAALYGYYRGLPDMELELRRNEGKMTLVFDWGGGTLDLTLCQIKNGAISQIINRGNNKVGGDYLDEIILKCVEDEHAKKFIWTESTFKPRLTGMKARLLQECERAKIVLSKKDSALIYVPEYFKANDDEADIEFSLDRDTLNQIAEKIVNAGLREIETLLSIEFADVDIQTLSFCLATGGMVNMPIIRQRLQELFGFERLHISEIGVRIISHGAAWIAHDNPPITLAKPFEIVEARNSMITIVPEGTSLPKRGDFLVTDQAMYCADPRDGKAVLSFKRPQMISKSASADHRTSYGNIVVNVNKDFPPLKERIDVTYLIDENLIVTVKAKSMDESLESELEIYDLEFSIQAIEDDSVKKSRRSGPVKIKSGLGVIIRSNVSEDNDSWHLVPGELMKLFNAKFPYFRKPLTEEQEFEQVLYQTCSSCNQRWKKGCCELSLAE